MSGVDLAITIAVGPLEVEEEDAVIGTVENDVVDDDVVEVDVPETVVDDDPMLTDGAEELPEDKGAETMMGAGAGPARFTRICVILACTCCGVVRPANFDDVVVFPRFVFSFDTNASRLASSFWRCGPVMCGCTGGLSVAIA